MDEERFVVIGYGWGVVFSIGMYWSFPASCKIEIISYFSSKSVFLALFKSVRIPSVGTMTGFVSPSVQRNSKIPIMNNRNAISG